MLAVRRTQVMDCLALKALRYLLRYTYIQQLPDTTVIIWCDYWQGGFQGRQPDQRCWRGAGQGRPAAGNPRC